MDLSPGPLVLITAPLLSPPWPMIGYLYLSKEAPWGPCVYVHHFDGALFIRADRDAEIDNLYYSCGLHRVCWYRFQRWIKIKFKELFLRLRREKEGRRQMEEKWGGGRGMMGKQAGERRCCRGDRREG